MRTYRPFRSGLCLTLIALLTLIGCAGATAERPVIVASSTIVGDLVSKVTGSEAVVEVLMPIGADPCEYQPTPTQITSLRRADLIVTSGLGLEQGLSDVIDDAERGGVPVLRLGEELDPRDPSQETAGEVDPYWWMDPLRAAGAIHLIADRMSTVCPGQWVWRALEAEHSCYDLDDQIQCLLARYVPEERRVVSNQAGLGYFAERYGFSVTPAAREPLSALGPESTTRLPLEPRVLPSGGVSVVAEPESEIVGTSVMDTSNPVFDGVGSVILFVDSLGLPGSGAETYLDMMLTNAERIADAEPGSFVERARGGA